MRSFNNSGQAVLETLITLPVIFIMLGCLAGLGYSSFIRSEVDEIFYLALKCKNSVQVKTTSSSKSCEQEMKQKLKKLQIQFEDDQIRLNARSESTFEYRVFRLFPVKIKKTFEMKSSL